MKESEKISEKRKVVVAFRMSEEEYKKLMRLKKSKETISELLRRIIFGEKNEEKDKEIVKEKVMGKTEMEKVETGIKEMGKEVRFEEKPQVENVVQKEKIEEQPQAVETKEQTETGSSNEVTLTIADNIKVSCASCKHIRNLFSYWKCEKYGVTMNIAVVYRCKDFEPRE
jgi:predicted CopG family antitoxin